MDHLGARVRLLHVVGERYRVELADAVITTKDAAGVLPGDGGAGLYLGPGDLGIGVRHAALGHKVVDAAFAVRRRRDTSSVPSST
jgi:hypothetical protein